MSEPNPNPTGNRLAARLLLPGTFEPLIADFKVLAAAELKKKGMTLRTAFNVVQKVKPDILDRVVRELMPGFVNELEPCYADFLANGSHSLRAHLVAHDTQVAAAVFSVADQRAERIYSRTIRSAYSRVRARAQREIVAAVPDIATVIARHAEYPQAGGASDANATDPI